MDRSSFFRQDAAVALMALGLLVAWDAGGWNLPVARHYGNSAGFALRDAWTTSIVLHEADATWHGQPSHCWPPALCVPGKKALPEASACTGWA